MLEHPEYKFSVEGHTDSDGDDALNQKLPEIRSQAVMQKKLIWGAPTGLPQKVEAKANHLPPTTPPRIKPRTDVWNSSDFNKTAINP